MRRVQLMARVLDSDEPQVVVADAGEIARGIARELAEIGLSFAQLEAQAVADEFDSEHARRLWFMISPLAH